MFLRAAAYIGARTIDGTQFEPAETGLRDVSLRSNWPRKQTLYERHRITKDFRRDCARENGELCLNRDHELSVATAARIENLTGRSFRADGWHR